MWRGLESQFFHDLSLFNKAQMGSGSGHAAASENHSESKSLPFIFWALKKDNMRTVLRKLFPDKSV